MFMHMYMYVYTWRSKSGRISVGAAQVAANPVLVMSGLPPGLVDNTDMVSAWQACKPKCCFLNTRQRSSLARCTWNYVGLPSKQKKWICIVVFSMLELHSFHAARTFTLRGRARCGLLLQGHQLHNGGDPLGYSDVTLSRSAWFGTWLPVRWRHRL